MQAQPSSTIGVMFSPILWCLVNDCWKNPKLLRLLENYHLDAYRYAASCKIIQQCEPVGTNICFCLST